VGGLADDVSGAVGNSLVYEIMAVADRPGDSDKYIAQPDKS
jgi:hypothetical protein